MTGDRRSLKGGSTTMPMAKMHSIAIQTSAFDQSFDFYTKVLGLRVVKPPSQFKSRILAWLDGGGTLIELYSVKAGCVPEEYREQSVGVSQVAFEVDDLDEAISILGSHGIEIRRGPLVPPTGDPRQPRILFINDPDGAPVQLRESKATADSFEARRVADDWPTL